MSTSSQPPAEPGKWAVLIGACLGVFSLTMNGTALITAVPAIRHSFDLGPTTLQWIVTIYFLVGAIFLAAAGRIGDRFGHGRVFLAGALCFLIAFAMIGLASNALVVLLGRALQGFAGALLLPLSLALIQITFPMEQRKLAAGIWSGALGLGLGVGPIVGGLFTHYLDWRYVFWANFAVTTASFAIVFMALRGHLEGPASGPPQKRDYLGFLLLACSMGTITYALTHAQELGLLSGVTLSLTFVALVSFVALLIQEQRAVRPFLDLRFFHHRRFVAATFGIFCTFFLVYAILYFASIFIQNVLVFGYTAELAGLSLLSLTLVLFVVSTFVHRLIVRFGDRGVVTTGMVLLCLGALLLHLEVASEGVLGIEAALLFCGLGLGLTLPVFSGIGLEALPKEQTGQGSGVLTTFTFLGATIGVSLGGVVWAGGARSALHDGIADLQINKPAQLAEIESGLDATKAQLNSLLGQFDAATAQNLNDVLQRAVDAGFADLTLLCAILAGAGAVAQSWLLKHSPG